MTQFDAGRFGQDFAASLLGDAAYDAIKRGWGVLETNQLEAVRVFQRALVIAVEARLIEPETADRYLARIAALPRGYRGTYLEKTLQPPTGEADARQTAVVIRNHAHMDSNTWEALTAVLGVSREVAQPLSPLLGVVAGALGAVGNELARRRQFDIATAAVVVAGSLLSDRSSQRGRVATPHLQIRSRLGTQSIETSRICEVRFLRGELLFWRVTAFVSLTDGSSITGTLAVPHLDVIFDSGTDPVQVRCSRLRAIRGVEPSVSPGHEVALMPAAKQPVARKNEEK